MRAPRISVVVMTMNRPEALADCLGSLAAQTLAPEMFEVVVVDVSDPPAHEVVNAFAGRLSLRHRPAPNRGVSGNRNIGVEVACGRLIAFLDDDCVAEPDWLELLTLTAEAHPGALVGGRVENADPTNAVAVAGQVITEGVHAFFNPPGAQPRFLPGLNFAVERERFLAVGGCDDRFGRLAAEDRDFVDRWRLAGGQLVHCPSAVVRHAHRYTLSAFVRQHVNYGRGAWRYHHLRRVRRSGRMREDIRLHFGLRRHVGPAVMQLGPEMRARVILLLATWQMANAVGFVSQGVLDAVSRRIPRT